MAGDTHGRRVLEMFSNRPVAFFCLQVANPLVNLSMCRQLSPFFMYSLELLSGGWPLQILAISLPNNMRKFTHFCSDSEERETKIQN
jgi:hypothetical protein